METNANVEILVHVTAPCRPVDDARYRALAQAYLDFKPVSQTRILGGTSHNRADTVVPSSQAEHVTLNTWSDAPMPSSEATEIATSPLPVSPRIPPPPPTASFRSPELSFRSVLDNRNSPSFGRAVANRETIPSSIPAPETQQTRTSWEAPPSVVDDSQLPTTISFAGFSSPSRLFEHLAGQFDSQAGASVQQPSPCTQHPLPLDTQAQAEDPVPGRADSRSNYEEDDGQIVLVASSESSLAGNDVAPGPPGPTEKVILNTPYAASKRPTAQISSFEQVVQETPCQPPIKRPFLHSPSRAGSEPPFSSKRHKRSAPMPKLRSITRSSSDVGPTSADATVQLRPPNERHLSYLERLEIHPAGPAVGCAELTPDDLLTPKLRELARQLNIKKRYSPVGQKRELRPFERGHWQLDWNAWRPTLRERAWHFLTDYILEGFAGWGVWCKRAVDWSWLRVYCWGHVVGHVYLALYLASERALKKDGARWVDGAGEVIVVMRGHENSESGESMEDGPDDET
ncbi:hypothetical protein CCHL11_01868 [Colletotrichum chlorophyti]|uniref:Uncharacterized protein n=1 Tax=Colletotrichum chlorophyti TaxID=708187 RepID=A0A1Q8RVL2_9PEZI|nr:hypothetical protein CCHL11_01868 [Colletotrichum chlorophyti]